MTESSGFQVDSEGPAFYEAQVGLFMAPFVEALVSAVVGEGDSVLDVACGTGFATRAAAESAGSGARVEGVDTNPAMVKHARRIADVSGVRLGWSEASALDLPFEGDEFDAVICQQGLQFFPDPAAGVAEMVRVTCPGGNVGLTVWSPPERSPFLHREFDMLSRHGGGGQDNWHATEPQLRAWLVAGGITDATIEEVEVEIDLPPVIEYVPEHLKALPSSASFRSLDPDRQATALAELDAELAQYRSGDGIRIPFTSFLVTATI